MRHRKFTFKIGRTSAHRRSLLANATCSLFLSGRIKTTVPKAKQIRRMAEKMITLGKKGTLHARRRAIAKMRQPAVVATLFSEIAPRYENRQGGYTRIIRLGQRQGDAAEMCLLELVEETPSMETTEPTAEAEETGSDTPAETNPAAAEAEPAEKAEEAEAAEPKAAE
jgi:large subunit ribosomal protein L17